MQVDGGDVGYVSGCHHHPPENDRLVFLDIGDGIPFKGFYRGAFYRTETAYRKRLAVHPVRWTVDKSRQDFPKTDRKQ